MTAHECPACRPAPPPFKALPSAALRLVRARSSPAQYSLHGLHHLNSMHHAGRLHRIHRLQALSELIHVDRAIRPLICAVRVGKIERLTEIEASMLSLRGCAVLGKKFTGSMGLVGHFRHRLEPVMPQLAKHHSKADAGLGDISV